jgi:hypothetical protein
MNKAFQPPSKPSPNWPLKPDESEACSGTQDPQGERLTSEAKKTPSGEDWKSSPLALELIDCLKDSNAQRH